MPLKFKITLELENSQISAAVAKVITDNIEAIFNNTPFALAPTDFPVAPVEPVSIEVSVVPAVSVDTLVAPIAPINVSDVPAVPALSTYISLSYPIRS
jgi:hypothetical protein